MYTFWDLSLTGKSHGRQGCIASRRHGYDAQLSNVVSAMESRPPILMSIAYPQSLWKDHAHLRTFLASAERQNAKAMRLYSNAAGAQARLFQTLIAYCCQGSCERLSGHFPYYVGGCRVTHPSISFRICRWSVGNTSLCYLKAAEKH